MNAATDGVFAINKPKGMSSAQVIRDCQACFNPSTLFAPSLAREAKKREQEAGKQRGRRRGNRASLAVKMGHGGTLDPLASGVLILGVNNGTKSLSRFLECSKTYEAVVVFGASSDSQDRVGKLLKRAPYEHLTKEMVRDAIKSFVGTIRQTPPLFSALKMNGKPLYEYAREGLPIPRDIPMREVDVEEIELLEWYEPGTHRHFWPTEEADEEEKELAQKVENALHREKKMVGSVGAPVKAGEEEETPAKTEKPPVGSEPTRPESSNPLPKAPEHGEKRKAPDQPASASGTGGGGDDKVYEAPSKRPKIQSSPVMSGALPSSSEGTPIASASASAVEDPVVPAVAAATTTTTAASDPNPPATTTTPHAAPRPNNPLIRKGKGSDLIPATSPTAPPPWGLSTPGPPAAKIRLRVSSGFYVRTFCHDLGEQLGSAALMAELVRTSQAMFKLGEHVAEYPLLHEGEAEWSPKIEGLLRKWVAYERKEKMNELLSDGEESGGEGEEDESGGNKKKTKRKDPKELEKIFWGESG